MHGEFLVLWVQVDAFTVCGIMHEAGICEAAGIGENWAPRELRTSFVSLLSASGVPLEEIARLAGHSSSARFGKGEGL